MAVHFLCPRLLILFLGVTAIRSMPADIFPEIDIRGGRWGQARGHGYRAGCGNPWAPISRPGYTHRALDPGTRNLLTEVDVPNADGELSPRMYSTVELQIPRKTPSLIVPDAAVVFDAQGVYVFVVENGVVRQHQITEIRDLAELSVLSRRCEF